ncbi:single-stranded DNA-binding protein [Demequina sp.]|uniref:single-stranded DNA-binding protein n=1 Tax=Demequina sp. TaxID=2050685 RepID=UPI003D0ED4B8
MATITVEGNLTDDLSLSFAQNEKSTAYARGRLVENHRQKNAAGDWEDKRGIGYNFTLFGKIAENAAESLSKGDRVIVTGELEPNDYVDGDGNDIESSRIVVSSISPSLRYATVSITKNPKAS